VKQSNNPWVVLVIGLAGLGLFGWLGWQLFVVGGKTYTERDLEIIFGTIERGSVFHRGRNDVLEIRLMGQPLPFIASSITYPRCFRADVAAMLKPGQPVIIGVSPEERIKPYRSGITREPYLNVYSLILNGEVMLSVDDYNRCSRHNDAVGRIVDPILLAVSMMLLIYWVRTILRQRRTRFG
jgi:hypothetical protein